MVATVNTEILRVEIDEVGGDQYQRSMRKSSKETDNFGKSVNDIGAVLAKYKGLILSVVTGAIGAYFTEIGRATLRTGEFAEKIGVSVEALSEYQFVAKQTGVEVNVLQTAWQRQTRRISEAAQGTGTAVKALQELQIPVRDIINLAPDEQFEKISEAMQGLPSQADRVRVAMALWDTEGVELVKTVNAGSEAIDEMRQRARELGLQISGEDVAATRQFAEQWEELKGLLTGIGRDILQLLLPPLTALLNLIKGGIEIVKQIAAQFMSWAESIGLVEKAAKDLSQQQLQDEIKKVKDEIEDLNEKLGERGFGRIAENQRLNVDRLQKRLGELERQLEETKKDTDSLATSQNNASRAADNYASSIKDVVDIKWDNLEVLKPLKTETVAFVDAQLDGEAVTKSFTTVLQRQAEAQRNAVTTTKELHDAHVQAARAAQQQTTSVSSLLSGLGQLSGFVGGNIGGSGVAIGGTLQQLFGIGSNLSQFSLGNALTSGAAIGGAFGGQQGALGAGLGASLGYLGGTALAAGSTSLAAGLTIGQTAIPIPVVGALLGGGLGLLAGSLFGGGDEQTPAFGFNTWRTRAEGERGRVGQRSYFVGGPLGARVVGGRNGQGLSQDMIDFADRLVAIDTAVADFLEGDTERLEAARQAAQTFGGEVDLDKFDPTELVQTQYQAVFNAIGGIESALFDAFDPSGDNVANVVAAVSVLRELGETSQLVAIGWSEADDNFIAAVGSLGALSEILDADNPFAKAEEAISRLDDTSTDVWQRQIQANRELVDSYDGSIEQTIELAGSLVELEAATGAILVGIESARRATSATTTGTLRRVRQSGLTARDIYEENVREAQDLQNQLLINPDLQSSEDVTRTIREINQLLSSGFFGLSAEQQEQERAEVTRQLEQAQRDAEISLQKQEERARQEHEQALDATRQQMQAAANLNASAEELSDAAGRLIEASRATEL